MRIHGAESNEEMPGRVTGTWTREESISQPFLKTTLFLFSAAANLKMHCFEKLMMRQHGAESNEAMEPSREEL